MSKFKIIVIILGSLSFFADISYGLGWLLGWLFLIILQKARVRVIDNMLSKDEFPRRQYIVFLFGVFLWIALPLLIGFIFPEVINPIAVFAAFFADRILTFITGSNREKV